MVVSIQRDRQETCPRELCSTQGGEDESMSIRTQWLENASNHNRHFSRGWAIDATASFCIAIQTIRF
jgi:hypothetical protein